MVGCLLCQAKIFIAGLPRTEARLGQSPILIEYGQSLFFWLSRD